MPSFQLASWNTNSLKEKKKKKKIEDELKAKDVSIACLQDTKEITSPDTKETTSPDKPETTLPDKASDYKFYFSGIEKEKNALGVAFAYKKKKSWTKVQKIKCHLQDRMSRIKIETKENIIHIINVYAPIQSDKLEDIKETVEFYKHLEKEVSNIQEPESVFIIGDFNAHVGADNVAWPTCLGAYGVGKMNDNGERLLEFCASHNMCVLNTYFNVEESERFTHRNNGSKTWSQVDLCLTRETDREIVTSANPVGELLDKFDHKMVIFVIDMQPPVPVKESSEEIHEIPSLFRYLLNSLIDVVRNTNGSSFKVDTELWKVLLTNLKIEDRIKLLESSLTKIKVCFDKDKELDKKDIREITKTILGFFCDLQSSEAAMKKYDEEVKRNLMECKVIENFQNGLIMSGTISKKSKVVIQDEITKYSSLINLNADCRKTMIALTINCCEDFVLPREFKYLSILKQCSEFSETSISTQCIAFVNTLSNSMKRFMFLRLKSLNERMYSDLQENDIFKCKRERDMLFALNLLQEQCAIKNFPLFIAFVDISQSLQNINTNILVKLLKYGTQWHFYLPFLLGKNISKDEEMQKCEPLLLEFLLSHILHTSFNESEKALPLKYRYERDLLTDTSKLNAMTIVKTFNLRGIQFEKCAAIFAMSVTDVRKSLENLENTFTLFGLSYVQSKPVVIMQNVQETITDLQIGSKKVNISTDATFLGVNFKGRKFSHTTEILSRVHNACRQLYTIASETFTQEDKLTKYKETILPILLKNVDVLTLSEKQEKYLEEFNARCLCRLKLDPGNGISKLISSDRLSLYKYYAELKEDTISKRMLYGKLNQEKNYTLSYVSILKKDSKKLTLMN